MGLLWVMVIENSMVELDEEGAGRGIEMRVN